jgi:RecJ-like exonuclease
MPSVGIAAGMGDTDCLKIGSEIDAETRKSILTGIRAAEDNLTQLENVQWFDSSESGFTGIICGAVMSYIGDPSKPTIGFNGAEPKAMLSSRATFPLLEKKVDMAAAMRQACESVGGNGGGHKIAAGGSIPRERRDDFLKEVDRIVGEQKKS